MANQASTEKWEFLPVPDGDGPDAQLILRLNALGSLYFFEKFVLQRHRLVEHLHRPICNTLERQRQELRQRPMQHRSHNRARR